MHKNKKITVHEVDLNEKGDFTATGRRMYIDDDAPLQSIAGWAQAKIDRECSIPKSMFDQIVRIVDESLQRIEKEVA